MSHIQAIFTGALIIAASVLFANSMKPAVAMSDGPYQLMHHSNTSALAGVFRIDTTSGEVSYCFLSGNNGANLVCTNPVR